MPQGENLSAKKDDIQYMRAIAIILVVLQHAVVATIDGSASQTLAAVCYNIDIYVFMFISGYLYEKNYDKYQQDGNLKFFKKKFVNLIIPYLFWECILYFGAWVVYNGPSSLSRFSGTLESLGFIELTIPQILLSLITFNNSYIELYWFLYALFVIFVIHHLTRKLLTTKWGLVGMVLALALIMCFGSEIYIVEKIALSLLVFTIGRMAKSRNISGDAIKVWMMICAVVLFGILFVVPIRIEIAYLYNLCYLVEHTLMGICGVIIIVYLVRYLGRIVGVKKGLKTIGDYSLSIYLLHNPWIVKLVSLILPGGGAFTMYMHDRRYCDSYFIRLADNKKMQDIIISVAGT